MKRAMVQWIGGIVKDNFEKLVNETGEECEDTEDTFLYRRLAASTSSSAWKNVMSVIVRFVLTVYYNQSLL